MNYYKSITNNSFYKFKTPMTIDELKSNNCIEISEEEFNSLTKRQTCKRHIKNETKINIANLKKQLAKYKEDVEQVELFGMERADYEEKKKRCAEIILELRKLEAEINGNNR